MLLEQIVVSSTYSRTQRQNEVIARSPGIDDQLAESVLKWSPTGNDLALGEPESFNFFHPDGNRVALSRSFIGERQKSRDGARHIVSHVAVCSRNQLEGYHNNIVLLAHTLRTMGAFILQSQLPEELSPLEVPDSTFFDQPRFLCDESSQATENILHAIEIHHQVVVVGAKDPLEFLARFLGELPTAKRLQISFSTALNPNSERPFTLQLFSETDGRLEKEFASRQLRTIALDSNQVVSCDY